MTAKRDASLEYKDDPKFAGGTTLRIKTFYLNGLPRRRLYTLPDDAQKVAAESRHASHSYPSTMGRTPIRYVSASLHVTLSH